MPRNPTKPIFPVQAADELPGRVRANLLKEMQQGETFRAAVATEFRPNPDMPYAWLVLTSRRFILCNSHRTRGIYAAHRFADINESRLEIRAGLSGALWLTVLLADPNSRPLIIPFNQAVDLNALKLFCEKIAVKGSEA